MNDVVFLNKIDVPYFVGLMLCRDVFFLALVWEQFHGNVHLVSVSYSVCLIDKEIFVEFVISLFLKEFGDALAFGIQCDDIEWHARIELGIEGILVNDFLGF